MKSIIYFILLSIVSSFAVELVNWESPDGMERFGRSEYKTDFFKLANNFESQSNKIFCGPTSAVIVLNALREKNQIKIAEDKSLLSKSEMKNLPKEFNPFFKRYTQKNVFSIGKAKSKEAVLGRPIKGKQDFGFQLRQFNDLLKAHKLKTMMYIVSDKVSLKLMQTKINENLKNKNDYVLVNYARKSLGQEGGGHISPIGAYDEKSDSYLVMDVNPNKAPWVWVKAQDLYNAMNTFDTIENRGFILISDS